MQGLRINNSIVYYRCVILCDGFYEWQSTKGEKEKQPYFIYAPQPEGVCISYSWVWSFVIGIDYGVNYIWNVFITVYSALMTICMWCSLLLLMIMKGMFTPGGDLESWYMGQAWCLEWRGRLEGTSFTENGWTLFQLDIIRSKALCGLRSVPYLGK